jgi:hypothetical protein
VAVFVAVPFCIGHILSMVMGVMQVCVSMLVKVDLVFMVMEMVVGLFE